MLGESVNETDQYKHGRKMASQKGVIIDGIKEPGAMHHMPCDIGLNGHVIHGLQFKILSHPKINEHRRKRHSHAPAQLLLLCSSQRVERRKTVCESARRGTGEQHAQSNKCQETNGERLKDIDICQQINHSAPSSFTQCDHGLTT